MLQGVHTIGNARTEIEVYRKEHERKRGTPKGVAKWSVTKCKKDISPTSKLKKKSKL
jgi:hypothetical protein